MNRFPTIVSVSISALVNVARRSSRRARYAVAAAAAIFTLLGGFTWVGLASVTAANGLRLQVESFIDETRGLALADVSRPAVYSRIANQSRLVAEAADEVRLRLAPLRPARFVPLLGGRIRSADNTANLASQVGHAAAGILDAYADALTAQSAQGRGGAAAALAPHRESLREANLSLAEAERLLSEPLALSGRQHALISVAVSGLTTLAVVGVEAPAAVGDSIEIIEKLQELEVLINDPATILTEPSVARGIVEELRTAVRSLREQFMRLAAGPQSRSEEMALALQGATVLASAGEAVAALLNRP